MYWYRLQIKREIKKKFLSDSTPICSYKYHITPKDPIFVTISKQFTTNNRDLIKASIYAEELQKIWAEIRIWGIQNTDHVCRIEWRLSKGIVVRRGHDKFNATTRYLLGGKSEGNLIEVSRFLARNWNWELPNANSTLLSPCGGG
jgi:hypothetical protein